MKLNTQEAHHPSVTGHIVEISKQGYGALGETGQLITKTALSSAVSTALWPVIYSIVETLGDNLDIPSEARLSFSWLLWAIVTNNTSYIINWALPASTALSSPDIEMQQALTDGQTPETWQGQIREAVAPYAAKAGEMYAKLPVPLKLVTGATTGYAMQMIMDKAGLPPAARAGLSAALTTLCVHKGDKATGAGFSMAPALKEAISSLMDMTNEELRGLMRDHHVRGWMTADELRNSLQDAEVQNGIMRMADASQANPVLYKRQTSSNDTVMDSASSSTDLTGAAIGTAVVFSLTPITCAAIATCVIAACCYRKHCSGRPQKPKLPPKPEEKRTEYQPQHEAPRKPFSREHPEKPLLRHLPKPEKFSRNSYVMPSDTVEEKTKAYLEKDVSSRPKGSTHITALLGQGNPTSYHRI